MNAHFANRRLHFALVTLRSVPCGFGFHRIRVADLVSTAAGSPRGRLSHPDDAGRRRCCVGPLLTLVVASPTKPRQRTLAGPRHHRTVQIAALGYGVHAAYVGRPVFIVFNAERFETVSATELDTRESSPAEAQRMSVSPFVGHMGSRTCRRSGRTSKDHRGDAQRWTRDQEPARLFRHWPHDPTVDRAHCALSNHFDAKAKDAALERLAGRALEPSAGRIRSAARSAPVRASSC